MSRGVWVGRYVIMPDHLHLFVSFGAEAVSLSMWVKSLKNFLSKALRDSGYFGKHWQKGFFDHVIRSQESYEQKSLYVRDNPIRAGLVRNADDWPYAGDISQFDFNTTHCARS